MTSEVEFVEAIARALGPLYRVTLVDVDGRVLSSFGTIEGSYGAKTAIPLPSSVNNMVLEMDVAAVEGADRVLHALAEPHSLAESPLGAFAHLQDALDRLLAQGQVAIGRPLEEMTRAEKRQLVRFLDERGAFALRKAVEQVADSLGVSRFTVYNYLDSSRLP